MSSIASPTLWFVTIGVVLALLVVDFVATRRPHEVSMKEAIAWSAFYVALPLTFGLYVWNVHGGDRGLEYYTGYLVEKTLSVDNLFVFMLLLAAFAVPEVLKQRVLLYGIIGALVLRGIFIALGAAALSAFDWVFLVFGARAAAHRPQAAARRGLAATSTRSTSRTCARSRLMRRFMPVSDEYDGPRFTVVRDGVRMLTPFALVTVAVLGDRRRLRRRLGARRLRHHRRPLPRLRDQRLRPARPARALLRARGRARRAGPPRATASPRSSASSALKLVLHWAHLVWPAVPDVPTLASLFVIVGILGDHRRHEPAGQPA